MTNNFNKKILAIIPARGGSARLPGKNSKLLAGKPLIVYTIEAGLDSNFIDKVVVSTDDPAIIEISQKAGAHVVKRPEYLATSVANVQLAIEHVLETLKEAEQYIPDIVVLLQPTSPLRTAKHISEAVEQFVQSGHDSMVSVSPFGTFLWTVKDGNNIPVNYDINKRPRTQDKAPEFKEHGAIYITTHAFLTQNHNVLGGNIGLYIMPEATSIDIDTEEDFQLAQQLLKK